jgi:hypothetical protein
MNLKGKRRIFRGDTRRRRRDGGSHADAGKSSVNLTVKKAKNCCV